MSSTMPDDTMGPGRRPLDYRSNATMAVTTVTIYTCDRCGASVQGPPPLGTSQVTVDYYNAEPDVTVTLCPSDTEALLVWYSTPPQ